MNDALTKVLSYIMGRLREPSSYPAMILILSAIGMHFSPEQKEAIIMIGLFVAGLIGAILPDRVGKNTRAEDVPPAVQPPEKTP